MYCVVMGVCALFMATGVSANGDDGPENQFTVELFPAPEAYRMGGFPPGMTRQSFTAAHGSVVITLLDKNGRSWNSIFPVSFPMACIRCGTY